MKLDVTIRFLVDAAILQRLDALIAQGVKIMETADTINAKLDDLATKTTAEHVEVRAMIQALQDQIAAGSPVTAEQLDAIGARLDQAIVGVQAISDADPTP